MVERLYKHGFLPFSFLFCVLLGLGSLSPRVGEASLPLTQPRDLTSSSVDLDGDGINDNVQLESQGLEGSISVALSHSGAFTVLQFPPHTSGQGALSVQDIDGDGDVDLLWSSGSHLAIGLVCLNDGAGQFACFASPALHTASDPTHGASVKRSQARCCESILSSAPSPSPDQKLSSLWRVHLVNAPKKRRQEQHIKILSHTCSLPTDRGPPSSGC